MSGEAWTSETLAALDKVTAAPASRPRLVPSEAVERAEGEAVAAWTSETLAALDKVTEAPESRPRLVPSDVDAVERAEGEAVAAWTAETLAACDVASSGETTADDGGPWARMLQATSPEAAAALKEEIRRSFGAFVRGEAGDE